MSTERPANPSVPRVFWSVVGLGIVALLAAPNLVEGKKDGPCEPVVPCADRRGCPDMVVDPGVLGSTLSLDVRVEHFKSDDCVVLEGMVQPGNRKLLLFATLTLNLGAGDLVLGNPLDHPDWYDLQTCHGHPHIKEYADYRLWTPEGYRIWRELRAANPDSCAAEIFAAHPELSTHLINGAKRGFCFFDVAPAGFIRDSTIVCPGVSDPQKYFSCDDAGLSICWGDLYDRFIDGQWIDITGLMDGEYVLENEANARHFFTESDYTNNSAAVRISIRGPKATALP